MTEDQKNELENLNNVNNGKQLDDSSYVCIDLSNEQVKIEDIFGGSEAYDLNRSDLHRAIQNNQGKVKEYLIEIEQVLFQLLTNNFKGRKN